MDNILYYNQIVTLRRIYMITIKQVAKLAGVSPTTASYALNHRPEVKEETRRRVVEAARQLNYIPNKVAQNFRYGTSHIITVLTEENLESGNTFSAEFFGILAGAREKRYDVLVKLINTSSLSHMEINSILGNRLSDGYLLLGNNLDNIVRHFLGNDLKGVLLSAHSPLKIPQVNVDGKKWIERMTDLAFAKGRKSPAYITNMKKTREELLRAEGFCNSLRRHGLVPREDIDICEALYDPKSTEEAVSACIARQKDVIICWNDELALRVISLLRKKGKRVPEEIAVSGFDDNAYYQNMICPLTTVRQPFFEKGRQATELLIDLIENRTAPPDQILLDCCIVQRESL